MSGEAVRGRETDEERDSVLLDRITRFRSGGLGRGGEGEDGGGVGGVALAGGLLDRRVDRGLERVEAARFGPFQLDRRGWSDRRDRSCRPLDA